MSVVAQRREQLPRRPGWGGRVQSVDPLWSPHPNPLGPGILLRATGSIPGSVPPASLQASRLVSESSHSIQQQQDRAETVSELTPVWACRSITICWYSWS